MRVVIADDSAIVRDGLSQLLPAHGIDVVAAAGDVPELLAAIEHSGVDVALVDIRMPPDYTNEGIVAAREIRTRSPEIGVLVLSQHVEADYALELLRDHPASCGYLLKERITQIDILVDAIKRVGQGETVIDHELVALLTRRPATRRRLEQLTAREREVLALMAEGLTDRAIADRLWVTTKTVETHVRHILARLRLPADPQHNRRVLAVLTYMRNDAS